jgi:hypothetical protein
MAGIGFRPLWFATSAHQLREFKRECMLPSRVCAALHLPSWLSRGQSCGCPFDILIDSHLGLSRFWPVGAVEGAGLGGRVGFVGLFFSLGLSQSLHALPWEGTMSPPKRLLLLSLLFYF